VKLPPVLISLACLLSAASGQWSVPVPVPNASRSSKFVINPGDTLRVLWTSWRSSSDSFVAYSAWSLGDSWSAPESIGCTEEAGSIAAGLDGQGRLWFLWYDGLVLPGRDATGCVVAGVRERAGWRYLPHVLCGGGEMQSPVKLDIATDQGGQSWLGICEHHHEASGKQYNSARFGRLQGDTCTWPGFVMKGDTEPNQRWVYGPLLAPRPDSGMWSVCEVQSVQTGTEVYVHVLHGDTAALLHRFGYVLLDAVADSAGRLWVIYSDTLWRLWSATVGLDSTVEYRLIADRLPHYGKGVCACTDNEGWVWCTWAAEDGTVVVSWNRGGNWSQPEPVVGGGPYSTIMISDSRGRVYMFCGRGVWFGVHRMSRPGVEETPNADVPNVERAATVVSGVLFLPEAKGEERQATGVLLDALGRRVMELQPGSNDVSDLSPGVYFVRSEPSAVSREPSAVSVRKVIITR